MDDELSLISEDDCDLIVDSNFDGGGSGDLDNFAACMADGLTRADEIDKLIDRYGAAPSEILPAKRPAAFAFGLNSRSEPFSGAIAEMIGDNGAFADNEFGPGIPGTNGMILPTIKVILEKKIY